MISHVAKALVFLVALIHLVIAVTEIFLWEVPLVHSRLGFTADEAHKVAPIVANAGLYNSFLAAGLIWGVNRRRQRLSGQDILSGLHDRCWRVWSSDFETDDLDPANCTRWLSLAGSLDVAARGRTARCNGPWPHDGNFSRCGFHWCDPGDVCIWERYFTAVRLWRESR